MSQKDYLEIDPPIIGQKYFCISFAEPLKDVFEEREFFFFKEFIEPMFDKYHNYFCSHYGITPSVENPPKINYDEIKEDYKTFKVGNYEKLNDTFSSNNNNKTTIRSLKVRGSYNDIDSARDRAKKLQASDPKFNVFVGEVGYWIPFNPVNINDIEPEYLEQEMNELIKSHIMNEEFVKLTFENKKIQREIERKEKSKNPDTMEISDLYKQMEENVERIKNLS